MEASQPDQPGSGAPSTKKWIRPPHILFGGEHGRLSIDIVVTYVSDPINSLDLSIFQHGEATEATRNRRPSIAEAEDSHSTTQETKPPSTLGTVGRNQTDAAGNDGQSQSDQESQAGTQNDEEEDHEDGDNDLTPTGSSHPAEEQSFSARPTWTRMSLQYLDVETLRHFNIDWESDPQDASYVLIKRWVPEHEQDILWEHTRKLRKQHESKRGDTIKQESRPTYTRMSLKHLEVDTLIQCNIDFQYDDEAGFVLIKRWVPEWEQDFLWEHTRNLRLSRNNAGSKGKGVNTAASNWIVDKTMIRKLLPVARVICFGLDLASHTNTSIDFDAAAQELNEELTKLRKNVPSRKVVLIAHGYGNVLISKLLDEKFEESGLLENTAAISFFGAPWTSTDSLVAFTIAQLKVSRDSKLFKSFSPGTPITSQMQQLLRDRLIQQDVSLSAILEAGATLDSSSSQAPNRRTGSKDGAQEEWHLIDSFDFLLDQETGIAEIAKFRGTQDYEFQRYVNYMLASIKSHQILSAAKSDDRDTITDLMNQSADLTVLNRNGQTALHIAAEYGSRKVFDLLLATRSFNLERKDFEGNTVLHAAVKRGGDFCRDFVKQLLASGARPDQKNKKGYLPAQVLPLPVTVARSVLDLLNSPQRVIGPMLTALEPTFRTDDQQKACQVLEMSARELYAAYDNFPDSHVRLYPTVDRFVYGNKTPHDLFPKSHGPPMCQWYHLPMNNMSWVVDLFVKFELQMWPWPQGYRDYETPHSRSVYPQITKLKSLGHGYRNDPVVWAIMMPYISYEDSSVQRDVANLMKGRDVHDAEASPDKAGKRVQEIIRPGRLISTKLFDDTQDTPGLRPEIKDVISAYLHAEGPSGRLPLHPRRTLDQSYYYMLSDTTYRDRDQVVSRWIQKLNKSQTRKQRGHNILMVDQLWLWFVKWPDSRHYVITSFPNRDSAGSKIDDLVLSDKYRDPLYHTSDLISQIVAEVCKTLNFGQDDESTKFVEMFEGTIGDVEERDSRLFREFQFLSTQLSNLDERNNQYRKLRATLLKHLDIQKEVRLLTEVRDILDEIKMIEAVLNDQRNILESDEISHLCRDASTTEEVRSQFYKASELVERALDSFGSSKARAETVEKQIERLLDLKQKQANTWEAQIAREGAEETARQGNTLLVFTVVTIIFLPLSFMASFFALSVEQYPKDTESGNVNWPLGQLSGLLFGISLAVSIPFVVGALYVEELKGGWASAWHRWIERDSTVSVDYGKYIEQRLLGNLESYGFQGEKSQPESDLTKGL
ncbi:hypothetical protein GQ53DRAFT_803904 [Thozetella sp. PMI_491]|nr:hypothetical protein GQ53DRAFT_803904 [Thozetella sp. PMI_491]